MSGLEKIVRLRDRLQAEPAVLYAASARMWGAVAGLVTLLVVAKYLSPGQQGYYYSFASVLALQMLFELGFSNILIQFISHESAKLAWDKGSLTGADLALDRFNSIVRMALRWYWGVAALMVCVVTPIGIALFSSDHSSSIAQWIGGWLLLVLGAAAYMVSTCFVVTLEGLGQIKEVNRIRFLQAVASSVAIWISLLLGAGLYALGIGYVAQCLVIFASLAIRYRDFAVAMLRARARQSHFSWMADIFPLQWRTAISWASGYFISQALIPITFKQAGPVDAGKLGFCLSVSVNLSFLALAWITTKSPQFGKFIALKDFATLNRVYDSAFRTSLTVLFAASIVVVGCTVALQTVAPSIASRMLPPSRLALLLFGGIGSHIVFCQAFYARAFKKEPYVAMSVVWAALMAVSSICSSRWFGTPGILLSYSAINWLVVMPWSFRIFQVARSRWAVS